MSIQEMDASASEREKIRRDRVIYYFDQTYGKGSVERLTMLLDSSPRLEDLRQHFVNSITKKPISRQVLSEKIRIIFGSPASELRRRRGKK